MNARARFRSVMTHGATDRVPWLEEGLRDDVFERWRRQGMPEGGPEAVFQYDRRERIEVDLSLRDKGAQGLVTAKELEHWRRNLERPLTERLGARWAERAAAWRTREHLLDLPLHSGLFLTLGVRDWVSFRDLMYLLADEPEVVREALALQGELARRVAYRVAGEVELDLVSVSEPIGGNDGPLVGPPLYRDLVLTSYAGFLEEARRGGAPALVFMTYANAHALLPAALDAGFNCLWAMETEGRAMDYRALRREFGPALRLIGGIDLDSLLAGPEATEREMRAKVPGLLKDGGFIPLADGRVRATVSWPAYAAYRRLLEQMTQA